MNNGINWSSAAKYGLLLSSISVVVNLLSAFLVEWQAPGFIGTVISIAAIVGNFYLLLYIIRQNVLAEDIADQRSAFRYGMAVCMFSTVVCCLFTLLTYTVFLPDYLETTLTALFEQLDAMGAADMLDYDEMLSSMPVYLVLGEAINCLIVGLIYSFAISRKVAGYDNDPFAGIKDDEEDTEVSEEENSSEEK